MNQSSNYKRVWIRKPEGVPTALQVSPDDLVDDLKSLVMQKYPTTLGRDYDPADLILRLESSTTRLTSPSNNNNGSRKHTKLHPLLTTSSHDYIPKQSAIPISPIPISSTKSPLLPPNTNFQRPNSRNEDESSKSQSPFSTYSTILRPDQNVWKILEYHFPHGMTMNDALVIEVPQLTTSPPHNHLNNRQGSAYSSVFNSYTSPQKNEIPNDILQNTKQSLHHSTLPAQAQQMAKYSHSLSFSGEARQQSSKRQTPIHRRSQSNPQSPQSSTFNNINNGGTGGTGSNTGNNNTTLLMLPKDYNGTNSNNNKERFYPFNASDLKQKNLGKITENRKEIDSTKDSSSPSSSSVLAPNTKKIKSTTEKVFPSINVLIVEDNKINQKILQAFLRKRKINFQTAVNGEEAIQKWKQGGFHLVLMDIQLPVKSGIEAAMEIRRMEKLNKIGLFSSKSSTNITKLSQQDELDLTVFRTPVIIVALTASTSSLDRQKALAAGCNDYLTKPVNLDWLQNKITEWGCMQALIDFDHWKD